MVHSHYGPTSWSVAQRVSSLVVAGTLALLDDFRDRFDTPAVIGGVVNLDGALELDVTGCRRRDRPNDAATVDDRWHIGSCGKSMTAVLYGCLVEAGLAQWGTPIGALFPEIADIDPGWNEPTIDDLLHCRAGVAPNPPRSQMATLWASRAPEAEQRLNAAKTVLSNPPDNAGKFRYSNLGYIVVGAAIDAIAGMPYEQALRHRVLEPLGIDSLGFGPPPMVCGHRSRFRLGPLLSRGAPAPPDDVHSDNPTLFNPAGRMHLTVGDWAKFQRLFLDAGQPLLGEETVKHLLALPADDPTSMAMGWVPAYRLDGVAYGMQGSNTVWSATALIDDDMEKTSLVIVNDGRAKVLRRSAQLAFALLQD